MWSSSPSRARRRGRDPRAVRRAGVLAVALALLLAAGAAAPIDTARLAAALESFSGRVAGEARLTWFGFHVYDARLYTPAQFDTKAPTTQPFALELTYARSLDGQAIAETSRDEIARLGFGSEAQRRGWFARMTALFPDVERGTRIAGVNVPGVGVRFYVDGRFTGSVDDPEFARAFFAIWLDPRTRSPEVREGLLRRAAATVE